MDDAQIIISSLGALSYGGLFMFFLMINSLIPFPEEVFIIALGYLGSAGLMNMYIAGAIAIIGLFISDIVLFSLIKSGNRFLTGLGNRLLGEDFTKDSRFFKNHIKKIVFFSRFFIGFRFLGPFIAGTLKLKLSTFIFYDGLALLIFVPTLIFIGNYFQNQFEAIVSGAGIVRHWILFLLLLVLFMYLSRYFRRNVLKKFFPLK